MAEQYTMEIDANYPFGTNQGSAAGNQESGQENQQQEAQPQGEQAGEEQQQPQQGQQTQEQTVPVSAIQAIRQENQQLKNQLAYQQMVAMQGNQQPQAPQQNQQPVQQQQTSKDPFEGFDDDDVVTVADVKKALAVQQQPAQVPPQQSQQGFQQGQPDMRELQMQVSYPDYNELITNELPTILQQNPYLGNVIQGSENPYLTAYTLAKSMSSSQGGNQQQQGQQAQQIVNNLQKPGTAGGASAGGGGISHADYYAQLSDEDFEKEVARAKRG